MRNTAEDGQTGDGATPQPFDLSGGALCLDLANTADRPRFSADRLGGYSDLVEWSLQAGVIGSAQRDRLLREAAGQPAAARAVARRAVTLRECVYRIFAGLAAGRPPSDADLSTFNRELGRALARQRLARSGAAFDWSWDGPPQALDRPLWAAVRSAAELLTSGRHSAVRECASATCSWLFLDRSRAGRRRWCDMKTCGNRNKARRYYRRSKSG